MPDRPLAWNADPYAVPCYPESVSKEGQPTLVPKLIMRGQPVDAFWRSYKPQWFAHETFSPGDLFIIEEPLLPLPPRTASLPVMCPAVLQHVRLVLQYDQIYRHPCSDEDLEKGRLDRQADAFEFATRCAIALEPYFDALEDWQLVFTLLIFRHSPKLEMKLKALEGVQRRIADLRSVDDENISPIPSTASIPNAPAIERSTDTSGGVLYRFLHATVMDLFCTRRDTLGWPNVGGVAQMTDDLAIENSDMNPDLLLNFEAFEAILDPVSGTMPAPLRTFRIRETFTGSQYSTLLPDSGGIEDVGYDDWAPSIKDLMNLIIDATSGLDTVAVSISGGTDSMLLATLCAILLDSGLVKWKCILLNINYMNRMNPAISTNRPECLLESDFLVQWAKAIKLPLYSHRIEDITRQRDKQFRAVYEQVTREIRFGLYQHFAQQTAPRKFGVLLGHNLDDCLENTFSNLSRQIHFDNLLGMKSHSFESDVLLVRPLLTVQKATIRRMMVGMGIPFLRDSTPKWSNRGKMRDNLLTSIGRFNPAILRGAVAFSRHANFLDCEWRQGLNEWLSGSRADNRSTHDQLCNRPSVHHTKPAPSNNNQMDSALIPANAAIVALPQLPSILDGCDIHGLIHGDPWPLSYYGSHQKTSSDPRKAGSVEPSRSLDQWVALPRDAFFERNCVQVHFWVQVWFGLCLPGRPGNKAFNDLIHRLTTVSAKKEHRVAHGTQGANNMMKVKLSRSCDVWFNDLILCILIYG